MIDVQCSECGRVLLGTRQIVSLVNGDGGLEVAYVCWCGRPGVERVGRSRARAAAPTRPAPPPREARPSARSRAG